ncbi:hypothetical protein OQJ26_04230 [Legionella sp. PATHC038]|uniref:hypothetical protein n=1 Tax=Legionella sheltonii TaxID=2992041 RepID=UPI00224381D2|nr:hypothetical protein [Legionella sp. PATHC038]MCW8397998.1 hypothetical protein [Legionella sp. PATHC038]
MNKCLLKKIEREKNKIEHFIDSMRDFFSKTHDESERNNRLEVFDTLLLLATYAQADALENEFQSVLPQNERGEAINYLCQELREINGFCQGSFSDEHDVYRDLFSEIKFPTAEKKHAVRKLLSATITELIFEKTNTPSNRLGASK